MWSAVLQLLGRFSNIGRSKAVGYPPLKTIKTILELDAAALAKPCAGQGLCTRIFKIDECWIGSGALYIYSVPDLQPNLSAWSQTLVQNVWRRKMAIRSMLFRRSTRGAS
jgi:hypothetical protein